MTVQEKTPKKKDNDTENLLGYFKTHMRETISYFILVIGIILMFFDAIYGGIIVGLVGGIYFGDEVVNYLKTWNLWADSKTVTRNLISAGVGLAFFISSPAIFLGAAISIGIKQLFVGQS